MSLRLPWALDCSAVSDVGTHRSNNQDSAFVAPWGACVADGVGGGPAGELASSGLLHRVAAAGRQLRSPDEVLELLRVCNWDLALHSQRDPTVAGMATTFTGALLTRSGLVLAHVGDSRAYRRRGGITHRMTRDDSFVQQLVDAGVITPLEAASHPRRNIVTASLRGRDTDGDSLSIAAVDTQPGDRWLLCSDGVSDYLPDEIISLHLGAGLAPEQTAQRLVHEALDAGSTDNVTAVVCDIVMSDSHERSPLVFHGAAADTFTESFDSA